MKTVTMKTAALLLPVILIACGGIPTTPSAPPAEEQPPNNIMAEWQEMAEHGYEYMDYDRAMQIGHIMAQQGQEGLEPFFEIISSPDETPAAKMLAVITLSLHITGIHLDRLMALTEPEHDEATRGCAIHLLSYTFAPDAVFRTIELMNDENPHVSKVATLVMLRKGDANALKRALELWDDPETPIRDRAEIVLGIPDMAAINNLHIYTAALCNDAFANTARARSIELLGLMAGPDVLPDLKACLDKENDLELRDMMEGAIAAIEKRDEEGLIAVPFVMPNGMDLLLQPTAPETTDHDESPAAEE